MRVSLHFICCLTVFLACRHACALASFEGHNSTDSEYFSPEAQYAPARRLLFGFDVPTSLSALTSEAKTFVEGATAKVSALSGLSNDFTNIVAIFTDSQPMLDKGIQIAQTAWNSFSQLAAQLMSIFSDFAPLKPIFESKSGLVQLLTSKVNMHTLISVISKVLSTSTVLKVLSGASHSIMEIFGQLQTVLKSALAMIPSMRRLDRESLERRLSDATSSWTSILDGLHFSDLLRQMAHFVEQATHHALQLEEVKAVLSPLLGQLDSMLGYSATTVAPSPIQQRRLGISGDQEKYSKAIAKIVPSWQAVENLGISMCPKVLDTQNLGGSLKCRVSGFVTNSGSGVGGLLGMVGSLSKSCPSTSLSAQAAVRRLEGSRCPTKSLSSGITDLLGQNSGMLGYLLAGLAACGCLGAGAVAGVSAAKGGAESDDEVEDDQVELMTARDDGQE